MCERGCWFFWNVLYEFLKDLISKLGKNSTNIFFACLLQGKLCYTSKLKTPSQVVGPKPLFELFLLQMDNYAKDNKNRYLLSFLSLLITREVFENVKLGLIVVSHTHENIH